MINSEASKLLMPIVVVALGWFVGLPLATKWALRQKRREMALAASNEFHRLYGEFFAVWKSWNFAVEVLHTSDDPAAWQKLFDRAASAEGSVESLLVRVATERRLDSRDMEVLARFRQGYQQLREAIRDGRRLDWNSSHHREYLAFKSLACEAARLIVDADGVRRSVPSAASVSLQNITSNAWEGNWADPSGLPPVLSPAHWPKPVTGVGFGGEG